MRIEDVIQQKSFKSEFIKLDINISYTSSWLSGRKNQALKPHGISWQQFNILRILKGMGGAPASVKLLTERMIDKTSNASRLVDKLKQKGLVERKECPADRRRVEVVLTDHGIELLKSASKAMEGFINENSNLSDQEAIQLNQLLDKLRS